MTVSPRGSVNIRKGVANVPSSSAISIPRRSLMRTILM